MRITRSLLAITMLSAANTAVANVELTLPTNSELVLVNGKESDAGKNLTLDNGENQIALRYLGRYQQQGSQTQFSSDVIIVKFSAKDEQLTLALPRIRSNNAADAFNRKPELTLLDSSGNDIAFKQDKLIKEGMQLGRDYEAEISAYNNTSAIAAVATLVPAAKSNTQVAVATGVTIQPDKKVEPSDQVVVGKMLDFWYAQADEETRKAFKAKINSK